MDPDLVKPPPHLEGYLLKQDPRSIAQGWKKRFFVVRKDIAYYYHDKSQSSDHREYTGVIKLAEVVDISEATFRKVPKKAYVNCGFTLTMSAAASGRVYSLLAETPEERHRWVKELQYVKTYWNSQEIARTTVLNEEEIAKKLLDELGMDDDIPDEYDVYGGDDPSMDGDRRTSRAASVQRSQPTVKHVVVYLANNSLKRIPLGMDGTAEMLIKRLGDSLSSSNCRIWQVNRQGTARVLAPTETITPLKPNTKSFYCLEASYLVIVVFFSDDSFESASVPFNILASKVTELECMKKQLAKLGISNAGLFLREPSGREVLFANDDRPCSILYDTSSADGLHVKKAMAGQLVMKNKSLSSSRLLTLTSPPDRAKPFQVAASEKRKREMEASRESQQQRLLENLERQRKEKEEKTHIPITIADCKADKIPEKTEVSQMQPVKRSRVFSGKFGRRSKKSGRRLLSDDDPNEDTFEIVDSVEVDEEEGGQQNEGDASSRTEEQTAPVGNETSHEVERNGEACEKEQDTMAVGQAEGEENQVGAGGAVDEETPNTAAVTTKTSDHHETNSVFADLPATKSQAAVLPSLTVRGVEAQSSDPSQEGSIISIEEKHFSEVDEDTVQDSSSDTVDMRPEPDSSPSPTTTMSLTNSAWSSTRKRSQSSKQIDHTEKPTAPSKKSNQSSDRRVHFQENVQVENIAGYDQSESSTGEVEEMEQRLESPGSVGSDDSGGDEPTSLDDQNSFTKLRSSSGVVLRSSLQRQGTLNRSRREKSGSFADFDEMDAFLRRKQKKETGLSAAEVKVGDDEWTMVDDNKSLSKRHNIPKQSSFDAQKAAMAARASIRRHTRSEAPSPAAAARAATGQPLSLPDIVPGLGERQLSRGRSVHVKKEQKTARSGSQTGRPGSVSPEGEERPKSVTDDDLVNESRAESFGERPMLTIQDLRKHTETMDKVNELLERPGGVATDPEPEVKQDRVQAHLGDLHQKLKELDKQDDKGRMRTKPHHPLPVDIDRLKPTPLQPADGSKTAMQTVGKPIEVRTPAVLKVVKKQSTQLDGSLESSYSKPMDFISLSGVLLRNHGGTWRLETGTAWHEPQKMDDDDHTEAFTLSGAIRAVYNHSKKQWYVRPVDTMPSQPSAPAELINKIHNDNLVSAVMPTSALPTDIQQRQQPFVPIAQPLTLSEILGQKQKLVQAVFGAVEELLLHFSSTREPDKKEILGDDSRTAAIGHLVRGKFCSALASILADGLKPTRMRGLRNNSLWDVVMASARLGLSGSSLAAGPASRAVEEIRRNPHMLDQNMKFRTFVCAAFNHKFLESWLDQLRHQQDVLQTFYAPGALMQMASNDATQLFDNLLLTLQPLMQLPFRLWASFEYQHIMQRQRQEQQLRQQEVPSTLQNGHVQVSTEAQKTPTRAMDTSRLMAFVGGKTSMKSGAAVQAMSAAVTPGEDHEAEPSTTTKEIKDVKIVVLPGGENLQVKEATPSREKDQELQDTTLPEGANHVMKEAGDVGRSLASTTLTTAYADTVAKPAAQPHVETTQDRIGALRNRMGAVGQKLSSTSKQAIATLKQRIQAPQQRYVETLYENMADDADELSFAKGEILEVAQVINNEWLLCCRGDQQGMVPANYVQFVNAK